MFEIVLRLVSIQARKDFENVDCPKLQNDTKIMRAFTFFIVIFVIFYVIVIEDKINHKTIYVRDCSEISVHPS